MSDLASTLRRAAQRTGPVLFLTGAGISAESGIPTFRGKDGYWTVGSREYHPQEMATAAAFAQMPREVWRWYLYRRHACRTAQPNPAHRALARLEDALGDGFHLVTQNVDGLHLRAGNTRERTYEIHGNIDFMRCTERCTETLHPLADDLTIPTREQDIDDPTFERLVCPDCGSPARPHVLWFDEYYEEGLYRAQSAAQKAAQTRLLVVVGTSGATNLPLQIGHACAQRGVPMIDVNPDDNVFGELARRKDGCCLRAPAAEALPELADALLSG